MHPWTFDFEEDPEIGERICVHRVIGPAEDVYRKPCCGGGPRFDYRLQVEPGAFC
jgi:hypothetical protein